MLQVAVPNKGALSEDAVALLREGGYRCVRYGRELVVRDNGNDVNFVFLRPRDIAIYVGNGIIELGISGRDLVADSGAEVRELLALEFGRSRFCYAAPKDKHFSMADFNGKRIATSYPRIVEKDLARRGFSGGIVRLDGAVEISVQLGVADCIADVVESGRTLTEAGLEIVGEPVLLSEAVLIGRDGIERLDEVKTMLARLRGILLARKYAVIEYDVEKRLLDEVCKLTPGIEAPTVSPLANPDWVAVKAMIRRSEANDIMDKLYALGARGIIVSEVKSCRI